MQLRGPQYIMDQGHYCMSQVELIWCQPNERPPFVCNTCGIMMSRNEKRLCFVKESPSERQRLLEACVYRGIVLRQEPCKCPAATFVDVYQCDHPKVSTDCTVWRQVEGAVVCRKCAFQPR